MITRKRKKEKPGYLFSLFIVSLFLIVIGFFFYSNWKIEKRRQELKAQIIDLEDEIQTLEQKNESLKSGVLEIASEDYVEEVARERLSMKKEGEEMVVVLPGTETESQEDNSVVEKTDFFSKILSILGIKPSSK